jgi:benzoylformate decarboxylase
MPPQRPGADRSVGQATTDLLRALGLTTVFGNPGSTELPFFREWPGDFRYVLGLQEASVVAMADGFAQATGNAAFVNLHSATGLGHALGSVFTAFRNQTPLVITAGQQTRAMLPTAPYLYAERAPEFPRPYVKWSSEPARPADVPAAVAHAYYCAMQRPCGPTFVSIPADDWDARAEPVTPRQVVRDVAPDPEALEALAGALSAGARPALVVGPGVDREGGWDAAVELAERLGAPAWASPLSSRASFPEDHPCFAGFLPPVRRALSDRLAGHDVVLVLGAPVFTYHVHTEGSVVPPGTRLYQITDDPDAAARAPVGTSLVGSVRLALARLLDRVARSGRPLPAPRPRPPAPRAIEPISGEFVMHTVAGVMPRRAVVVEEAPSHRNAMHDHLPIRAAGGFYAGASGGLGWALPAAVGVALADPARPVVCLVGDGSSLYSIQALWTAAAHRLPITVVVLDNGAYVALKAFGRVLGVERPPGVDLPGLDFVALARGFGCEAARVERAGDLAPALARALEAGRPALLDVRVDPGVPDLY